MLSVPQRSGWICHQLEILVPNHDSPKYQFQLKMDPPLSLVIHDILPTEILEMIFVEHATLEWKAPSIDGQVCRLWRRIVLNTPREWAYFTIRNNSVPIDEVRLRLQRSSPAPLHIDTRDAGQNFCQKLYDLFSDHHTRIASLRVWWGSQSFFEERDFPCMQRLDAPRWDPVRWGSMPKLHYLRLGAYKSCMLPLSELPPLKILILSGVECTSVLRHTQSLTTLMLCNVNFVYAISGPLTFPCLTYLSLHGVRCLKPHVDAPRLLTYHEGGGVSELFNISLPSLVEYGVIYKSASTLDPAAWRLSFPNIRRLAIRAEDMVIISIFSSLANQPYFLPSLQTISVGNIHGDSYCLAEGTQEEIERLVLVRNKACDGNVVVCFETQAPFKIPIFFGAVSDCLIKWPCALLTHIPVTKSWLLKTLRCQVLARSHSCSKL